jgi:hypothetical protein
MLTVNITIEGGVIQHVNCPPGVSVIVRDYDVDDQDGDVFEDEIGDKYRRCVYDPV